MKLKKYLKESGYRSDWFSEQIPCSAGYFSNVVHGKSKPSAIMMRRIATLTGGQVTKDDFEIEEEKNG